MRKFPASVIAAFALVISLLTAPSAPALSFNSHPATHWGNIYAAQPTFHITPSTPAPRASTEKKSDWQITYNDVPSDIRPAIQKAIETWSENFSSKVTVNVDISWEALSDKTILASARPGFFYNAFPGSPDDDLWYPSALANALANRDLDPSQSEILLRINSTPLWYTGTDGRPSDRTYDLSSVVLHEIAHGLGFLSNAEYENFFNTGYMYQPTPFDAYAQTQDGRYLADFCSRSIDLGKALTSPLYWAGPDATAANNDKKVKLYSPPIYSDGSSITHLDEETFTSSLNALMTPKLEPGESFSSPGPIALAMINDMLAKPPLGEAASAPAKPVNVKALIGDKYAILTFDSPNCRRANKVLNYTVTINPTGTKKTYDGSPIRIDNLQNGKPYSFTVAATNDKGSSDPVTSNTIKPESSGKTTIIDPTSTVEYLAATDYKGYKTIIYADKSSRSLKMATLINNKWKLSIITKNADIGAISACPSGTGTKSQLNVFYADTTSKDLKYALLSNSKWTISTIDGDGEAVQDYREPIRTKTASDVSVSNACAVTPSGLQVFYRDETQGILLGAAKTGTGWVYEIVDGDSKKNGRTTGDVGFHISATALGKSVYLLYDSVLIFNSNKSPTSGEVRLAIRSSIFPEDWRYQTLDGPDNGIAVAGYSTALAITNKKLAAVWIGANGSSLPNTDQIRFTEISDVTLPSAISTDSYGSPTTPLALDAKGITFGCANRLCKFSPSASAIKLANGATSFSKGGAIITLKNQRYLVTAVNEKLSLVTL